MKQEKKKSQKKYSQKNSQKKSNIGLVLFAVMALVVLAAIVALGVTLASKGGKQAKISTLTLNEDGTVVCEEVTEFEEGFLERDELEDYANSLVESFNETNGKEVVTLDSLKVKKDSAYLKTTFKTLEDYSIFSSYTAYCAKIDQALEDGYEFEGSFAAVEAGDKTGATSFNPYDYTGYYVLVIEENIKVAVPGRICFVTDANTRVDSENSVIIGEEVGSDGSVGVTYVVYEKVAAQK